MTKTGLRILDRSVQKLTPVEGRTYPLFGYAPGDYFVVCLTCDQQHLADKRSLRCEPCAEIIAEDYHSMYRAETPDGVVFRLGTEHTVESFISTIHMRVHRLGPTEIRTANDAFHRTITRDFQLTKKHPSNEKFRIERPGQEEQHSSGEAPRL